MIAEQNAITKSKTIMASIFCTGLLNTQPANAEAQAMTIKMAIAKSLANDIDFTSTP